MKEAKQDRKLWEKAYILMIILTILFSSIALGTFLLYEGNLPKLSMRTTIIEQKKLISEEVQSNNYTIVEIISWEQSQEVINATLSIDYYPIKIDTFSSNENLNIYLIDNENYIELNLTKNISKIKNLIPIEEQNKFENKNSITNLETKLISSNRDIYYFVFENKNNFTVKFEIEINTPKISVDDNEEINKYITQNRYLKNLSDSSIIILIVLFFATVYSAYRWMKENI